MGNLYRLLAIVATGLAILLIVVLGSQALIITNKADQNAELYNINDQREIPQYSHEQNEKLQYESEQNEKLQYETIFEIVDANSDYYIEFSKKFIEEYKVFNFTNQIPKSASFSLHHVKDRLKSEYNDDLLGRDCYIKQTNEIEYVDLEYAKKTRMFDYWHSSVGYYYIDYSIIYLQDEYLKESILIEILGDNYTSLRIKDNLFVTRRSIILS
jgi:hypothetical protein